MLKVPGHRLANPCLEGLRRLPAELTLDLNRVDRVTPVVARSVAHIGHLLEVAPAIRARVHLVKERTDTPHDLDVRFLVPATDVVDLTQLTCLKDTADRAAVILNIEPVTDLLAVTLRGQWLASLGVDDHERD